MRRVGAQQQRRDMEMGNWIGLFRMWIALSAALPKFDSRPEPISNREGKQYGTDKRRAGKCATSLHTVSSHAWLRYEHLNSPPNSESSGFRARRARSAADFLVAFALVNVRCRLQGKFEKRLVREMLRQWIGEHQPRVSPHEFVSTLQPLS